MLLFFHVNPFFILGFVLLSINTENSRVIQDLQYRLANTKFLIDQVGYSVYAYHLNEYFFGVFVFKTEK